MSIIMIFIKAAREYFEQGRVYLCAQASRREAIIELLVLAFLIIITLILLVDCFVELQQQL